MGDGFAKACSTEDCNFIAMHGELCEWCYRKGHDEEKYFGQVDGSCCTLYALCNALRFFGKKSPVPGTWEWADLVDYARCRHGGALQVDKVAARLGLQLTRVLDDLEPPTMLTVVNPNPKGMHLHSCLYIGRGANGYHQLVNYRVGGPVVEEVSDIEWPGPPNARHYNLSLKPRRYAIYTDVGKAEPGPEMDATLARVQEMARMARNPPAPAPLKPIIQGGSSDMFVEPLIKKVLRTKIVAEKLGASRVVKVQDGPSKGPLEIAALPHKVPTPEAEHG